MVYLNPALIEDTHFGRDSSHSDRVVLVSDERPCIPSRRVDRDIRSWSGIFFQQWRARWC